MAAAVPAAMEQEQVRHTDGSAKRSRRFRPLSSLAYLPSRQETGLQRNCEDAMLFANTQVRPRTQLPRSKR